MSKKITVMFWFTLMLILPVVSAAQDTTPPPPIPVETPPIKTPPVETPPAETPAVTKTPAVVETPPDQNTKEAPVNTEEKTNKSLRSKNDPNNVQSSEIFESFATQFDLSPALIYIWHSASNVKEAKVKNGKALITDSQDAVIKIGVEGHITFGYNWTYKDTDRRSARIGAGPFAALILNGDSVPTGGAGLLISLQNWQNNEEHRGVGMNIGYGFIIDNTYQTLPEGYQDGKDIPGTDETKEKENTNIELTKKTGVGHMIMISFNVAL